MYVGLNVPTKAGAILPGVFSLAKQVPWLTDSHFCALKKQTNPPQTLDEYHELFWMWQCSFMFAVCCLIIRLPCKSFKKTWMHAKSCSCMWQCNQVPQCQISSQCKHFAGQQTQCIKLYTELLWFHAWKKFWINSVTGAGQIHWKGRNAE